MGAATELLRRREDPQQATFLELFFDLAYVFAFTRVSQLLVEDLTLDDDGAADWRLALANAGKTLLLLLALFWVWSLTVAMTSGFAPRRPTIQVVVVATMFASMVMGVALPGAFDQRGLAFAGAYVAIQVGRPLFLGVVLRGHWLRRSARRALLWSVVSAVPWVVGGFQTGTARTALWLLAVAIDFAASRLIFTRAGFWPRRTPGLPLAPGHLAERFRQLLLIALGESILITGITFSGEPFEAGPSLPFAVAFVTTMLLWRVYFYRAGEVLAGAIAASGDPARLSRSVSDTHLVMVTGIVLTAVGYELVITHPFGSAEPTWLTAILGGPALFLAGRARFEYVVFGRVSRSRLIGLVVLVAIAPALVLVPPVAAAISAAVVLAGVAVTDAARSRRNPEEAPSPPA